MGMNELVSRARAGDARAFGEIHDRTAGRVFGLCVRLTADPTWAQELTQDVFVSAWQHLDSFRGESQFTSWLYRLTVNVVLDAQRKRTREREKLEPLWDGCRPSRQYGEEWNLDLERAIARLPERARTALVLYAIEGYKYEEIAEIMDVAIGTVKAHISQARARLVKEVRR